MSDHYDLLIRDATIVDGTGAPAFAGSIGVRGDRIETVGRVEQAHADVTLDAAGMVAAPGFIDVHTHDDRLMLSSPDMSAKISQGVTSVVAGNCGISLAPMPDRFTGAVTPPLNLLDESGSWFRFPTFAAYTEELRARSPATNCALLVGHTTLRVATMDDISRPAKPSEIARMREMVREALGAGAIGVSTGLYYEPAAAAPAEEVIEVCRPLREFNGIYCTHMRNEEKRVLDSLDESFVTAREVGVPVVISHHKVNGVPNHGRSRETLALIADRMQHQPIGLDCYPYCASSTVLTADRAEYASRVIVTWSKPCPQYAGMDLSDVAREMNLPQKEAVARLLPAGAIYFSMDEADVQRILSFPSTMVGSDGLPHDAFPHPRLWSTFPRVLGHYCRDVNLFPLETAVHKMTGLSARTFGLTDRGVLRKGAYADVVLFDPAKIGEAATFEAPIAPAHGVHCVVVNGIPVWQEGKYTGARPGKILQRSAGA